MNRKKIINILEKTISPFVGKKSLQPFFEALLQFSLLGMNIGGGADPHSSGEKWVIEYIKKKLISAEKLTIFDVGGNVGDYSLLLKEIIGIKAEIYSFEPSPSAFQKLTANMTIHPGIKTFNFGFGNENITTTLFSDSDGSVLASIYPRKLDHFNIKMNKEEAIQIKTIDSFCDEQKISHIHFLKLDVEGHEKKVLDGAAKILALGEVDYIQFEFGGCDIDSRTFFQDFYYLLHEKYRIYRVMKDGLSEITRYKEKYELFRGTNYLAEKK